MQRVLTLTLVVVFYNGLPVHPFAQAQLTGGQLAPLILLASGRSFGQGVVALLPCYARP